jgi:hypothetical protein
MGLAIVRHATRGRAVLVDGRDIRLGQRLIPPQRVVELGTKIEM